MPNDCSCPREERKPFVPANTGLPFFAYGPFKAGEPLHRYIESLLCEPPILGRAKGSLRIRDGLPLLKRNSAGTVEGYVMRFAPECGEDAYKAIGSRASRTLYLWREVQLTDPSALRANVLLGYLPDNGSINSESTAWASSDDTVLGEGLALVRRIADEHGAQPFHSVPPELFDWERMFRLQMAYLYLWTVIERYAALAYGPELGPGQKVKNLGEDPLFIKFLTATAPTPRTLFDTRNPDKIKTLDVCNPGESAQYYFQVRNNLTHRGKGAARDAEITRESLQELLAIIECMADHTPGLRT